MKQEIRIIGGRYRGKKISFPDSEGLRPTPDRVRETLFNWLMHDIRNARCLDAFAGSGALGLEAFSRGASQVCFLEQNRLVFKALQNNIAHFNTRDLTLFNIDACDFIRHPKQCFDIIFLDPPFASNLLMPCLDVLNKSTILTPEGLVYFESPLEMTVDPLQWVVLKQKKAGLVFYGLLKKRT